MTGSEASEEAEEADSGASGGNDHAAYLSVGIPIVNPHHLSVWSADWAWGLPLIILTVMFHVLGLGHLKKQEGRVMRHIWQHPNLSIGAATLYIAWLHAFEAGFWAVTFLFLDAVPDAATAMLYSLNALTAFGHTNITLERRWLLMGAMESLNGWILFGLSTAYLFVLVQTWSRDGVQGRPNEGRAR